MKTIHYSVLRSAFAIILGLILVMWPEVTVHYIVVTIGIFFMMPGLFALSNFFRRDRNNPNTSDRFPIEATGSILLGMWLGIKPTFFINILMYILGAVLLLGGLQQIVMLIKARQWSSVPFGFYVMPLLIFVTGIMILTYPFEALANTLTIFGVGSIVYGAVELLNNYKFRRKES